MKVLTPMLNLRNGMLPFLVLTGSISLLTSGSAECDDSLSPAQQPEAAIETGTFASRTEELSYALGMNLGNRLRSHAVEIDVGALMRGVEDARSGRKTLLTAEQARAMLHDLQSAVQQDQSARALKNKQEGEAFLAKNKAEDGVITLESGLQYKILKAGDGQKPTLDDMIIAHYSGTLIDGTEIDSSHKRGEPSALAVKGVIAGWREALQLMPVGSRWQLFIPARLAYGERAVDHIIGPNSTLVFEVDLVSIDDGSGGITTVSASAGSPSVQVGAKSVQVATNNELPASGLADIKVTYKVDKRLTQGLYMGERWASPPTYNCVNAGTTCAVEAKIQAVDAKGAPMRVAPKWIPEDPKIVTVTPDRGDKVTITVLQAGETSLKVTAGDYSKELFITAKYQGNTMRAGISQLPPSP